MASTSFAKDIVPMFRDFRPQMLWRFDLASYEHVTANADVIYSRIRGEYDAWMPPPPLPPLTKEQIKLFKQWMDDNCPP